MSRFCYRPVRNYNYQLREDFTYDLGRPFDPAPIGNEFIEISAKGLLTIRKYYAWDGVSGPVIDTQANLKASLVHDALYQLMREGKLDHTAYREWSDRLFMDMCRRGGVNDRIAALYFNALRLFGAKNAKPRENATPPTICLE
jgi:hypothetical protein